MKKLLEKYLKATYKVENVIVNFYNIEGPDCIVTWEPDTSGYYIETTTINIWEMLEFLHNE